MTVSFFQMGKLTGLLKPGQLRGNKSTRIIKESALTKTSASKILSRPKRILMQQRRIQSLINGKV